jgi:hypothetical protein
METCEICDAKPVCRVVDIGDRNVRVCAACSAQLRTDPELLLAAARAVWSDDEEEGDERA